MQRPSETLWQIFGAWVKREREAKKLTQADAAKLAGIDRQQWYRIESGKSGTKRDTAIAIARALKVSEDEALRLAGYASSSLVEAQGFFSGYYELSPDRQKLARRQIKGILDSLAESSHDTDYIDDE